MAKQTLDQYKEEFKRGLDVIFNSLKDFGDKLRLAQKDLTGDEWEELVRYLKTWLTQADIDAAFALSRGELDPRLFPHAVHTSKVMSLSAEDQARLLSDEVFEVYDDSGNGDIHRRTWSEMTRDERNRLLGPKGGRIHPLLEQRKPRSKNGGAQTVMRYDHVDVYDGKLLMNAGEKRGEVELTTLHNSLSPAARASLLEALATE